MRVVGISKIVSNANPEGIAALWQRFYADAISEQIHHKTSGSVIAVYTRYQGDHTQPYTVLIGHEVTGRDPLDSSALDEVEIHTASHTKFAVAGKMPDVVIQQWMDIWNSGRKRAYVADYDIYLPDGSVEIYVEFSEK